VTERCEAWFEHPAQIHADLSNAERAAHGALIGARLTAGEAWAASKPVQAALERHLEACGVRR